MLTHRGAEDVSLSVRQPEHLKLVRGDVTEGPKTAARPHQAAIKEVALEI